MSVLSLLPSHSTLSFMGKAAPEAIRVSEALSGESTELVGSDATNTAGMAPAAADRPPQLAEDPQGDALRTAMGRANEEELEGALEWAQRKFQRL